jgi:hypothetical protein
VGRPQRAGAQSSLGRVVAAAPAQLALPERLALVVRPPGEHGRALRGTDAASTVAARKHESPFAIMNVHSSWNTAPLANHLSQKLFGEASNEPQHVVDVVVRDLVELAVVGVVSYFTQVRDLLRVALVVNFSFG